MINEGSSMDRITQIPLLSKNAETMPEESAVVLSCRRYQDLLSRNLDLSQ
jgi:hypothetical protein